MNRVNMNVWQGQIFGVIGPNGAGKTTLLNILSGLMRPDKGEVFYFGRKVNALTPHARSRLGMSKTFQTSKLFSAGNFTVLDNVMVGAYNHSQTNLFASMLSFPVIRHQEREIREKAMEYLRILGLASRALQRADALPVGDRRLVEIARCLTGEPRVLLLDEPAAGLNDAEVDALGSVLEMLNARGITIVLVEHRVAMVMRLCHQVIVLDHGSKIAEGSPAEVRADKKVEVAYFGTQTNDPTN
ncbi:MAG: ABC transporter ATP-binding protein [Clostridia bacterium]|nr:MAG: ABC transporter ATP-binding protein [Clostridia bacterium]